MVKTLRTYQDSALRSLWNYLLTEGTGHPLVVAPVGAGKSLMIAEFIRQCHEHYPRTRIIMLTHVKELLEQNAEELRGQYPTCDFGFYCAGLGQKRLHNDVTFASIQSIHNKIEHINRSPEIIIVDECHLIPEKGQTQYRRFFDAVLQVNPNVKIIGFTGSPFRADSGRLDEGENALFSGVCYEIGMDYMIEQGFWKKPVCPDIATKMDVSGVGVRGGDYILSQLEGRINTKELREDCVAELVKVGAGRRKWLVFTATVQHCEDVLQDLLDVGITARMVTGETPKDERKQTIEAFRRGEFQALVNVAVLTTGFNVPDIDLICFMRPTRSPVLYIQCTGRGVRPVYADGYDLSTQQGRLAAIAASHCPDCMVVDFGGVVDELGPIDQVSIKSKKQREKGESDDEVKAAVKICPACAEGCSTAQRYCYGCGYKFFELDTSPSNKHLLSSDEEPEWLEVLGWDFKKHIKKDAKPDDPATMMVVYSTMRNIFRDFVCFEHHRFVCSKRYAYDRAQKWYLKHTPEIYHGIIPQSVDAALEVRYNMPSHILIRRNGKYWNVIDTKFEKKPELTKQEIEDLEYQIPF